MPTLCGPDKLQKKSIERSVPKDEGAGCPFAYFSDKGKVRLADASRLESFYRSIHGHTLGVVLLHKFVRNKFEQL